MPQSIPISDLILMALVTLLALALLPGLLWLRRRRPRGFLSGAIVFFAVSALLEPLCYALVSMVPPLAALLEANRTAAALLRAGSAAAFEIATLYLAVRFAPGRRAACGISQEDAVAAGLGFGAAEALCVGIVMLVNLIAWIRYNHIGTDALGGIIATPSAWRVYPEIIAPHMTIDSNTFLLFGLGSERMAALLLRVFCVQLLVLARRGKTPLIPAAFALAFVPCAAAELASRYAGSASPHYVWRVEGYALLACLFAGALMYLLRERAAVPVAVRATVLEEDFAGIAEEHSA